MYDENAPKLSAQAYFAIPIAPPGASYIAKKSPVRFDPYQGRYFNLKDWTVMTVPITDTQPHANIGVRCGGGLIGVDCDTEEAAQKFAQAFPTSPVIKKGQKGFTAFFRADFDVPSENFFDADGNKVIEILSTGRQTVIPPSIHPDTKQPYEWTNGHSLYDTPLTELPLFPSDYRDLILSFGYTSSRKPKKPEIIDPETGEIQNGFGDNPCRELNDAALKNFDAWVPHMGLEKCHAQRGRYRSYRAVATWRESTTNTPEDKRDYDLSICSSGIKDFGDGRGYTPLDLVMAALGLSLVDAFSWLEEKLYGHKPDVEIDIAACVRVQDAPKTAPEDVACGNGRCDRF